MSVADDAYVKALLEEREYHAAHGRHWHVALVDDQLAKFGAEPRPFHTGGFVSPAGQPSTSLERADLPKPPETTAAPKPQQFVCPEPDCGYQAKTAAGLGAHRRSHKR